LPAVVWALSGDLPFLEIGPECVGIVIDVLEGFGAASTVAEMAEI
jgi:hypothetical protein